MPHPAQIEAADSAAPQSQARMLRALLRRFGTAADGGDPGMPQALPLGEMVAIEELNRILKATLRSRDAMQTLKRKVSDRDARIRELERQLEQMGELVREDPLTGSLNRRGFEDAFQRESARAARHAAPLCLAMLDIDDFKRLNDTWGHAAGDAALSHLVRIAHATLRTMDVVCRFGGEEFAVLLPDTTPEQAGQAIARLQQELARRALVHDGALLQLRFSAGVALCRSGEEAAAAIARADAALYRAKRTGKNRVVLAD